VNEDTGLVQSLVLLIWTFFFTMEQIIRVFFFHLPTLLMYSAGDYRLPLQTETERHLSNSWTGCCP